MLNLKYAITFSSTTKQVDPSGELSNEDSIQQQSNFSSNSLNQATVKRIDISALPTSYKTPNASRVYDIDLQKMQAKYLRILHAKSNSQFLLSTADTPENLDLAPRSLVRDFVLDSGVQPNPTLFVPDLPYPKYIRIINPLEINGGGNGNNPDDAPILVSLFIVCTKA